MPTITGVTDSGHGSEVRVGEGSAPAGVRVVGYVRPGPGTRMDCEQPLLVLRGDSSEYWTCDTYGCSHCAVRKQRRLQRLVHDGISHQSSTSRVGYFLTVTAPGSEAHRRWFQGRRPATRQDCSCHDHGLTMGAWNASESACWNRLRTSIVRLHGSVQFVGAVEPQQRGALHRHLVVFTDQPLHFDQVQALALAAGYGCVMDLEPLESPDKAARYISKYVTKSSTARAVIPWSVQVIDTDTGEITEEGARASYRLWSSSRAWGVTMKELRAVMAAQARNRAMYLRELSELVDGQGSRSAVETAAASQTGDPP